MLSLAPSVGGCRYRVGCHPVPSVWSQCTRLTDSASGRLAERRDRRGAPEPVPRSRVDSAFGGIASGNRCDEGLAGHDGGFPTGLVDSISCARQQLLKRSGIRSGVDRGGDLRPSGTLFGGQQPWVGGDCNSDLRHGCRRQGRRCPVPPLSGRFCFGPRGWLVVGGNGVRRAGRLRSGPLGVYRDYSGHTGRDHHVDCVGLRLAHPRRHQVSAPPRRHMHPTGPQVTLAAQARTVGRWAVDLPPSLSQSRLSVHEVRRRGSRDLTPPRHARRPLAGMEGHFGEYTGRGSAQDRRSRVSEG